MVEGAISIWTFLIIVINMWEKWFEGRIWARDSTYFSLTGGIRMEIGSSRSSVEEAWNSSSSQLTVRKQKARKRWCAWTSRTPQLKNHMYISFLRLLNLQSNTTTWEPSIQVHEPVGIFHVQKHWASETEYKKKKRSLKCTWNCILRPIKRE